MIGSFVDGRQFVERVGRRVREVGVEKGALVVGHDVEAVEKEVERVVTPIEIGRRGEWRDIRRRRTRQKTREMMR